MKRKITLDMGTLLISLVLALALGVGGFILWRDSPPAFGGNFAPQMAQQGARYQIAASDRHSAWVIDTTMGDVFLIYSNGKWKEIGSIQDEKMRIKK